MLNVIPYEAFFAIYLLISSNYIGELFSCKFRELLSNSMLLKHIIGIVTFGFLVILSGIDLNHENVYINALGLTFGLYAWFILSTRTHMYVTLLIVSMFLVMYIISYRIKYLKENKKQKDIDKLTKINKYLLIITGIITIIGVINYAYLKKKELNKRNETFSFFKFIIGHKKCRNDKLENIVGSIYKK